MHTITDRCKLLELSVFSSIRSGSSLSHEIGELAHQLSGLLVLDLYNIPISDGAIVAVVQQARGLIQLHLSNH